MPLFAFATLLPALLIALAAVRGGVWGLLAVLSMTALVLGLDTLTARTADPADPEAEFPAGTPLAVTLALGQLALVLLCVAALGGGWLGPWEKAALFLASGLWLGQVGNANAHELIHRTRRSLRRLGIAAYVSVLFGHHASAHPLVHHVKVGSREDPATARRGESFHRFALRAWHGGFRAGLAAERARRRGRTTPYVAYLGGAAICLILAALIGGAAGLLWYLALAGFAQMQLMMSDYVQHYGLSRAEVAPGKLEPVGPQHSWNAPHWYSAALLLNAPRHSDHHAHPARPYPALRNVGEAGPELPYSLPFMASIALVPRLWKRVMHPRLDALEQA